MITDISTESSNMNEALRNMAIQHINDAIRDDSLIVFVGAGASINSGLPSWGSLIAQLKTDLKINNSDTDYLKIAQYYYDMVGQQKYFQKIDDIFLKYQNAKPNEIHEQIKRINPKHIITTNYDTLIEKKVNKGINKYQIIKKDMDIPYSKSDHYLIKMHGDLLEKNFVLKEDDYFDFEKNFYMISTLIKSLIMNNTVLFIGYSLNDSTFNNIFRLIQQGFAGNAKNAFFFTPKPKEYALIGYYKNKGIRVFSESDTEELEEGHTTVKFLKQLSSDFDIPITSIEELWQEISFLKPLTFVDTKMLMRYLQKLNGKVYPVQNDIHWTEEETFHFSVQGQESLIDFLNGQTNITSFLDFKASEDRDFKKNSVLKKAYFLYEKNDFAGAKNAFQQIANNAFEEKDYWNYLIASFNVSHILSTNSQEKFEISERLTDVVDKLISGGNNSTKKLALFFRDEIFNFRFIYRKLFAINKFLDLLKIENVNFKEGGASFNNHLAELQGEFESLMQFINLNCITVYQYEEFQEVVNRYFECLIIAHTNYQIGISLESDFANASSMVPELTRKEVQNIVIHVKTDNVKVLLEYHNLSQIGINDEAFTYLVNRSLSILNEDVISIKRKQYLFTKYINFISVSSINDIGQIIDLFVACEMNNRNYDNIKQLLIILIHNFSSILTDRYEEIVHIISIHLTEILLKNYEFQKNNISLYAFLLEKINTNAKSNIGILKLSTLEEKLYYIENTPEKITQIENFQTFIGHLYSFLDPSTKLIIDRILKKYDQVEDKYFNFTFAKSLILHNVFDFPSSKDRITVDATDIPVEEVGFKTFPNKRLDKIIDLYNLIKMNYLDVSDINKRLDLSELKDTSPEFDWMFFADYTDKNVEKIVKRYGIGNAINIFGEDQEKVNALNNWILSQAKNNNLKLIPNVNLQ
ncbi:SIR2 family protein [Leuconostoc mesenteroides]|uniref:SIR2 family protein n=1 Tax=Leuconostoc mesenteroides TaxID=1245 RepID=UPI002362D1DF|nr:SIR2 family protein [Leuconostoc mesenteroides]